ncbi:MAG: sugar phosphate isomerase/epimerase [Solirubrobacteraceae bacterium]
MHLSMHNWMRVEPLERTCERLAACGYESIEIMGEPELYADHGAIRDTLQRHGIRCWGSVTLMLEERDLLHPEEPLRAASVQYVKDCIDLVADLGGQEITIVPGLVGKTKPTAAAEQEWEWAVAGLRDIYEHAGPKGVRMALEPLNRFETYFISRHTQALALAEAVGEDCGVCLDCFHINIEEADPLQAIREVGSRLADFHIADSNRMAAGQGHLDWPAIIETVRSTGYDHALTVEFVPAIDRTPANPYPNSLETEEVEISEGLAQFIEDHGSDVVNDEFYTWLTQTTADTLLPLIG